MPNYFPEVFSPQLLLSGLLLLSLSLQIIFTVNASGGRARTHDEDQEKDLTPGGTKVGHKPFSNDGSSISGRSWTFVKYLYDTKDRQVFSDQRGPNFLLNYLEDPEFVNVNGKECLRAPQLLNELRTRLIAPDKSDLVAQYHHRTPLSTTRMVYSEPLLDMFYLAGINQQGDMKTVVDLHTMTTLDQFCIDLRKLIEFECITPSDVRTFYGSHFVTGGNDLYELGVVSPDELLVDKKQEALYNERCNSTMLLHSLIDNASGKLLSKDLRPICRSLGKEWKNLVRVNKSQCDPAGEKDHCVTTQLKTYGHQFVVPGGRFRELYLWDTFFEIWALLDVGLIDTVHDTLTVFSKWIHEYSYIPNGGRTYYLRRSQPPMFASMVWSYLSFASSKIEDQKLRKSVEFSIAMEFLPAIIHELKEYWNKSQLDIVSGCIEKMNNFLQNKQAQYENSVHHNFITIPQSCTAQTLKCIPTDNSNSKNNNEATTYHMSCAGYHYGAGFPLHSQIENMSANDFFAEMSPVLPRIESYIHDIGIVRRALKDESIKKQLLRDNIFKGNSAITASDISSQVLAVSMLSAYSTYAESGWDFSTRWINDDSMSELFDHTCLGSEKNFECFQKADENKINLNYPISAKSPYKDILMRNIEIRRIYPIDLNSIILRSFNIVERLIQIIDTEGLPRKTTSSALDNKDSSSFAGERFLKNLHEFEAEDVANLQKIMTPFKEELKIRIPSLRNFISFVLWNSTDSRFCDYVDGHGCTQVRSAAELFAYWGQLYHGSVHHQIPNIVQEFGTSKNEITKAPLSLLVADGHLDIFSLNIGCTDYYNSLMTAISTLSFPGNQDRVGHSALIKPTQFQSSQQWDAPNSWAPLEYMSVYSLISMSKFFDEFCHPLSEIMTNNKEVHDLPALKLVRDMLYKSGHSVVSESDNQNKPDIPIAPNMVSPDNPSEQRVRHISKSLRVRAELRVANYINSIEKSSLIEDQTSKYVFYEKYDTNTHGSGRKGEYDVVEGFGWTNGVLQKFIASLIEPELMNSDTL